MMVVAPSWAVLGRPAKAFRVAHAAFAILNLAALAYLWSRDDPRIGPSATFGTDWLPGVAEWQLQQLTRGAVSEGTPR